MANGNWITHTTSGTGLSAIIPNLRVGYYEFRVRAENRESVSEWSTLPYELAPPGFLDAISGLSLDEGGTEFSGKNPTFVWNSIFDEADAAQQAGENLDTEGLPFVFKDYLVEILDDNSNLIRSETVSEPEYTYTFEKNVKDAQAITSNARRSFTISVRARGRQGQESAAQTLFVANPQPTRSGALQIKQSTSGASITFPRNDDLDFSGYRVWTKETDDIDPTQDASIDVRQNELTLPIPQGEMRYVRYAPFDAFSDETAMLDVAPSVSTSAVYFDPDEAFPDDSIPEIKLSSQTRQKITDAEATASAAQSQADQAYNDAQDALSQVDGVENEYGPRVTSLETTQGQQAQAITSVEFTAKQRRNYVPEQHRIVNDEDAQNSVIGNRYLFHIQNAQTVGTGDLNPYNQHKAVRVDHDNRNNNTMVVYCADGSASYPMFLPGGKKYLVAVNCNVFNEQSNPGWFWYARLRRASDGVFLTGTQQTSQGLKIFEFDMTGEQDGDWNLSVWVRGLSSTGGALSFIPYAFGVFEQYEDSLLYPSLGEDVEKTAQKLSVLQAAQVNSEQATLISQAQSTADDADTKATSALTATGNNASAITSVTSTATTAENKADQAQSDAAAADSKAQGAQNDADAAQADATNALNIAQTTDGKLTATAQLTLDVNGRITGRKFYNDGTETSVDYLVDAFRIWDGVQARPVFDLDGNLIRMPEIEVDTLRAGSIRAGALGDGVGTDDLIQDPEFRDLQFGNTSNDQPSFWVFNDGNPIVYENSYTQNTLKARRALAFQNQDASNSDQSVWSRSFPLESDTEYRASVIQAITSGSFTGYVLMYLYQYDAAGNVLAAESEGLRSENYRDGSSAAGESGRQVKKRKLTTHPDCAFGRIRFRILWSTNVDPAP